MPRGNIRRGRRQNHLEEQPAAGNDVERQESEQESADTRRRQEASTFKHSKKTKRNYGNGQRAFGTWLFQKGMTDYVMPSGVAAAPYLPDPAKVAANMDSTFLKYCLEKFGYEGDVDLNDENARAPDGVRWATVAGYRAAFNSLLEAHKIRLTEEKEQEVADLFCALKKIDARRRQVLGHGAATATKSLMPCSLYRHLAQVFLGHVVRDSAWAHCFHVLTWNLMCRANNTNCITWADLSWVEDSLLIQFAQTDQGGDQGRVPRHVFANPTDPSICPVTSLGLYLLTIRGVQPHMFPANEESRYGVLLRDYLRSEAGTAALRVHGGGLKASDIDTHSIRRGSSSFAASGSTACPNGPSLLRRGGWKTKASWETYIELLPAGDKYIGRLSCGLNVLETEFALLPPHFPPLNHLAKHATREVFGTLLDAHPHLESAAMMCLASLVHHSTWLSAHLPDVLRSHALFTDEVLLKSLKQLLVTGMHSPHMRSTGLPPHVHQLVKTTEVLAEVRESRRLAEERARNIVDVIESSVERALGTRVVQEGGMTREAWMGMLQEAIRMADQRGHGAEGGGAEGEGAEGPADPFPNAPAAGRVNTPVYHWGGGFHLVPEGWTLPKANLKRGWELWVIGEGNGIPSYKDLPIADRRHVANLYSNWKCVFGRMVEYLRKHDAWQEGPTIGQASAMFELCVPFIMLVLDTHLTNRNRPRLEQLMPTYVCKAFRNVTPEDMDAHPPSRTA